MVSLLSILSSPLRRLFLSESLSSRFYLPPILRGAGGGKEGRREEDGRLFSNRPGPPSQSPRTPGSRSGPRPCPRTNANGGAGRGPSWGFSCPPSDGGGRPGAAAPMAPLAPAGRRRGGRAESGGAGGGGGGVLRVPPPAAGLAPLLGLQNAAGAHRRRRDQPAQDVERRRRACGEAPGPGSSCNLERICFCF